MKHWLHGLLAALITSSCTAGLSILGVAGAEALGVSVIQLDFKQLGIVLISGGIVGTLSYLKQSPLPPEE